MVLALNTIWNEGNFDLRIENYRDHWGQNIAPFQPAFIGARWIDKGRERTVLTIRDPAHAEVEAGRLIDPTASARRTAVISFEDIRWQLVIKGDVKGGLVTVDVDGNKDFDLVVRADGQVAVRCLGGSFNARDMQVDLLVPPLQGGLASAQISIDWPCECSTSFEGISAPSARSGYLSQSPAAPTLGSHTCTCDKHLSLDALCEHTPRLFPPASYAMSEISPDLAMLLEELRADQRAILQKEFQLVGASFGERLWNGGRKLMGSYEPKEFLPMTALINVLVIPAIFLFTYLYNHRRHRRSLACSPLFPSPGQPPAAVRRSPSGRSNHLTADAADHAPVQGMIDGVAVVRLDNGDDEDGLPPPPYYPD